MSSLEQRLSHELLTHGLDHVLKALVGALRDRRYWESDAERVRDWETAERRVGKLLAWVGEGYRWMLLGPCRHYKPPWWKRW